MHLLTNVIITVIAYLLDRSFGEYRFIKHPVIIIGDLISFVERHLYKDSLIRGVVSVVIVLSVTLGVSLLIEYYLHFFNIVFYILVNAFLASMFIAHHMLRDAVVSVLHEPTLQKKRDAIAMLVSRDTHSLDESDIYKAAIETYAENLSDGVIAPLFYLVLFSLPGIVVYKTINTLDSMIGYRNEKYEKYGKAAAILDDIANYIPARITAVLITLRCNKKFSWKYLKFAPLHESPNAGYPISAMALCLGVQLGGDTSYFGKVKKKPHFGDGRKTITAQDVHNAIKVL